MPVDGTGPSRQSDALPLSDRTGNVAAAVDLDTGVAVVEFSRPPYNFFDIELIRDIADTYSHLDKDGDCRVIVLCSSGKHFCAGADFSGGELAEDHTRHLYQEAVRLFGFTRPVIAAVQGRAVGGGLGLALSADFRVAAPSTRFVCNFARLGVHHGFGISETLPALVGQQRALLMLYAGRTVGGDEAAEIQLCDVIVPEERLREAAIEMATEIAQSAPLAVQAIRRTMWASKRPDAVRRATEVERDEQAPLLKSLDFQEGVRAAADRRVPQFRSH